MLSVAKSAGLMLMVCANACRHDEPPPFCLRSPQPHASSLPSEGLGQHSSPGGDTSGPRDTGYGADMHGQHPAASMGDDADGRACGRMGGNNSASASPSAGAGSTRVNKKSPSLSQKRQLAKRKGVEVGSN
eukprot:355265-Chlamydomonas_euryale.AAC.20